LNQIEIVQLSKNNIAVTFNKHALKGLEKGGSQAIVLKQGFGRKDITFLFMRDKDFKEKFNNYNRGLAPKKSFWAKLWPFSPKTQIGVRETANTKYKDVKNARS